MRRLAFGVLSVVLVLLSMPVFAAEETAGTWFGSSGAHGEKKFGAGFIIGSPTGFSFKYVRDQRVAYDAAIGWQYSLFRIHADYLFQHPRLFEIKPSAPIDSYYGLGGRILNRGGGHKDSGDNGFLLGFRPVAGLRYRMPDPSLEFFGELAMVFNFIPTTEADFELGIGGRLFF